ncbi:hypothetical protein [Candidatus Binatus sp.]|uniref:hypothetical protein n=1 Tax=Candidatus Binatus sp. TaxID=2811406 RepID=UPI003C775753
MPIVECGYAGVAAQIAPLSPSDALVRVGPLIAVVISAHPTSSPTSPLTPAAQSAAQQTFVPALIDTGAYASAIDDALAQQLQLPIVNQRVVVGVGGQVTLNEYLGQILIPILSTRQYGTFTGAHLATAGVGYRAILGRTLLRDCVLVYDGESGSVKLAR